jgi:hypothetical protein
MPIGVHNGSTLSPLQVEQIVHAFAQGLTILEVAAATRHSHNVVRAIRDREWVEVDKRKRVLAAQAERGALLAGERLLQRIPHLPDNSLLPTYGVFVDKAIALRSDNNPTLHVEHSHTLSLDSDDLIAFAIHRAKHANAKVIPEPVLPLVDAPVETHAKVADVLPKKRSVKRSRPNKSKRKRCLTSAS